MLRCPACGGALAAAAAEALVCEGCGARYPVQAGVPWLFRDPGSARAQWAAKLGHFETTRASRAHELGRAAARKDLMASTRQRVERALAGEERLAEQVRDLLAPFALEQVEEDASLPRDRIPSPQHVASYLETVWRDWCWGEEEVEAARELVRSRLPEASDDADLLVVGGGAGRLAYELARDTRLASVVQLDINPLLTRVGARLCAGEALTLTELPALPRSLADVAVDQHLRRPGPPADVPLHFLLGDVFAPPFDPGAFDVVVSPWLIDILPEDFRRVARRLCALLRPGGTWISFGPLSFGGLPPDARYTPEEIGEALEEAGLRVDASELVRVPYLHSPHAMPRRHEDVLVFRATRTGDPEPPGDFAYFPPWMLDPARPIPALPAWQALHHQRVLDAQILGLIDGRASIQDIVKQLSSRYGLPVDACRIAVNRFFSSFFEKELLERQDTSR